MVGVLWGEIVVVIVVLVGVVVPQGGGLGGGGGGYESGRRGARGGVRAVEGRGGRAVQTVPTVVLGVQLHRHVFVRQGVVHFVQAQVRFKVSVPILVFGFCKGQKVKCLSINAQSHTFKSKSYIDTINLCN